VSLTIRPGERILLTGPSGAGKSTLLALLLGFVRPDAGTIQAGGAGLTPADDDRWRGQIAWVPQHPHLFAGRVADNIALGQPDASPEAIRQAARLAGAAEFIEALPGGYDAVLGERALRLSAGQRQKIALARAFLRDAPLLLLDDPPRTWIRPAPGGSPRPSRPCWPAVPSCSSATARAWPRWPAASSAWTPGRWSPRRGRRPGRDPRIQPACPPRR